MEKLLSFHSWGVLYFNKIKKPLRVGGITLHKSDAVLGKQHSCALFCQRKDSGRCPQHTVSDKVG
jgi:hypothetical protein